MANAGTVNVNLVAQTSAFHSAMQKAEGTLQGFHSTIQAGTRLLEAYLGYEAIAHVAEWVHQTMEAVEHQTKLADSLGVSTEKMQALAYSTKLAGGNTEVLGAAMLKMEENLSGVGGSAQKTRDALAAMGLTMRDLQGKSGDEQLMTIADGLSHVASSGDRAKIAVDLFGKAGAQLLPILNQGSEKLREQAIEAQELGLTYSRIDAEKIEEANRAIVKIKAATEGVAITITEQLAPLITGIGEAFVTDAKQGDAFGKTIHDVIGTLITMVDGFRAEWAGVKIVVESIALALNTSWAAALTVLDTVIRANLVFPFMLAKNAIGAVIQTFKQLSGPEIGDIFKHVGAEVVKFFADTVIQASGLMHKLGEMMVSAGIKGGEGFETASDAIGRTVSKIDVEAQRSIKSTQASMDKLKDVWKDVIPTWESTAIPGLSALAAKLRSNVSLLWNDLTARLNAPFNPHAFEEWSSKVTEIANRTAKTEAQIHQQQADNDRALAAERLSVDAGLAAGIRANLSGVVLAENEAFAQRLKDLNRYHDEALLSDAEFKQAEADATRDHQRKLADITVHEEAQVTRWEVMNQKEKVAFTTQTLNNLATLMQSHNKRAFEIGKAAAYASTVIATAQAAMESYKALAGIPYVGPYLGAAAAAAAIAAGAVQLATISSAHFDSGGGVSSGSFSGAGAVSAAAGQAVGPGQGNQQQQAPGVTGQDRPGQMVTVVVKGKLHDEAIRELADGINEYLRNGGKLAGVTVQS